MSDPFMESENTARPCLLLNLSDELLLQICSSLRLGSNGRGDFDSLKAFSQTNKYMRRFLVPDIFKSVVLRQSESLHELLRTLKDWATSSVLPHVKQAFRFLRDASNLPAVSFAVKTSPLLSDIDWHLVRCLLFTTTKILKSMATLQTLAIDMRPSQFKTHCEAFDPANISLPSVKSLMLGPGMGWIVLACPNVTSISMYREPGDFRYMDEKAAHDLIDWAAQASLLYHLEIPVRSTDMLGHVAASLPRLRSLAISYRVGIRDVAFVLSRFANLTHLRVPRASELGIGFNPPRCGNYYMGKDGQARREKIERERHEANRKVAELAFSACTTLSTVTIGDNTVATAERSKDGALLDFIVEAVGRDGPRPIR